MSEPDQLNDAPRPQSAWEAAAEAGIDMSLIELSLSLTPDERLRQHDCALRTLLMAESAGRKLNG
jgi:hypothetical protein